MQKTISAILCLMLLLAVPTAFASSDIDLSGMTYDELIALREDINLAMWSSDEWDVVGIPEGMYRVGIDIPAGRYVMVHNVSTFSGGILYQADNLATGGYNVSRYADFYNTYASGNVTLLEKCYLDVTICPCAFTKAGSDVNGFTWTKEETPDIDSRLHGLSFSALIDLAKRIEDSIAALPSYQSVKIGKGLYTIGQDIPAGFWHIEADEGPWWWGYGTEWKWLSSTRVVVESAQSFLSEHEARNVQFRAGDYFDTTSESIIVSTYAADYGFVFFADGVTLNPSH